MPSDSDEVNSTEPHRTVRACDRW